MKNLFETRLCIDGTMLYAMIESDNPMAAKRKLERVNEALEEVLVHSMVGEMACDPSEWLEEAEDDDGDWMGRAKPEPLEVIHDPLEDRVIFQRNDGTLIAEAHKLPSQWDLGDVNTDQMSDGEYRTLCDWMEAQGDG